MDIFSELNDFLEENEFSQTTVKQSIISDFHDFSQWFDNYFPEDTTTQVDIITFHSLKHPPIIIRVDRSIGWPVKWPQI